MNFNFKEKIKSPKEMSEIFRENVRFAYSVTFLRSLKKKKLWYGKTTISTSLADKPTNREFVGTSTYMQAPSKNVSLSEITYAL